MAANDDIGGDAQADRAMHLFDHLPYDHPGGRLRERIKELRCLYEILALTSDREASLERICNGTVEVLLRSYLHEPPTMVRIELEGTVVQSGNWCDPDPVIELPIQCHGIPVGTLAVGYAVQIGDELAFLPEEYELTRAVAKHLSKLAEDRRQQDHIRQSERTKTIGQLTNGLAHDFNNLLTVIMGSAEVLQETIGADSPDYAHAQLIVEAAERGSAITAQLLAYARRQSLSPQALDTAVLLGDLELLLKQALGMGIEFEIAVPSTVWSMHADRAQFENALMNLAVNARDAMPEGGRFRIAVSNATVGGEGIASGETIEPGEYVRIDVSDTGTGMAPNVAARAFEPFFTTKEGRGNGLGLSGVFGFVRQSSGTIELSTELGGGTTFSLYLPRAGDRSGTALASTPQETHRVTEGRILVVEDEGAIRQMVSGLLVRLGYDVSAVSSAAEALACLAEGPFDLLFSDIALIGGTSGVDLAIEAQRKDPQMGVLLTSGFGEERAGTAPELRFDYIAKPYRRAEIARKVADAIRRV